MSDVEARLRTMLHDKLDSLEPDRGRGATVVTRARRARRARAVVATLTVVAVLAGGIAGVGALTSGRDALPPGGTEEERGSFVVDLGEGRSAVVAVDSVQGQACFGTDNLPFASSVTLRRRDGRRGSTVATIVASPEEYAERKCGPISRRAAALVLESPGTHSIRFEVAAAGVSGELRPYDALVHRLPYEAEVVCGPAGAVALTPEVRPQHDGVHLTVYNFGGPRGEVSVVAPDGGNAILTLPRDRMTTEVLYFRPGPVQIACVEHEQLVLFDGPGSEESARLTIADRYGLWSEPELECGDGRRRSAVPTDVGLPHASAAYPRFEALARRFVPGVEPGDVLERPGYPDAPALIETRTIVRDGARIAKVWLTRRGDVWALVPWTCPGSGIAEGS